MYLVLSLAFVFVNSGYSDGKACGLLGVLDGHAATDGASVQGRSAGAG